MNILHVIPNFYPATRWGGPIFSTKAICDGIALDPVVKLEVLTTDAAGPLLRDTLPLTNRCKRMSAGYNVDYFPRVLLKSVSLGLALALPAAIRRADLVHVSSCYTFPVLPTLCIARILGRPLVWSPRGAIQATEEWEAAPRRFPKRLYELLARFLMPRKTVLHVTAESEGIATARRMPGIRYVIIPNCVNIPDDTELPSREWRPDGRLRLGFLSRIHEKKGLDDLISAMAKLPAEIELDIYGTGEAKYINSLKARCSALGLERRIRFKGHVDTEGKLAAYHSFDLFVLPSYSENFGIVIAEALAHGVPVITTNATPWQGLWREGCGEAVEVGIKPLIAAISRMAFRDLSQMGSSGRIWMIREFSPAVTNAAMLALYKDLT